SIAVRSRPSPGPKRAADSPRADGTLRGRVSSIRRRRSRDRRPVASRAQRDGVGAISAPPVRERTCIDASRTVLLIPPALEGLSTRHVPIGRSEMNVSDARPIHPKNAAGPFYVVNGCCTACGVPTSIAPELFEFDSADHCYVKRQPTSDTEMEKALRVLRTQELDCVRYRGTDERTLRRLAEAGEAHQCDHALSGVGVVLRNVVTFARTDAADGRLDARRLLEQFCDHLKRRYPHLKVRSKPIELREREASFAVAWF